jgi:hypothetical protein
MHLKSRTKLSGFLALLALAGIIMSNATAQITIRNAPGGKVLLYIDGSDLRPDAGGKRLLFIDGDDLRPAPGGKRLLFLDGDDVRPAPGGIRLATWDGSTLRRTPGGKILMVIEGSDVRPVAGGKRIYFLDGPQPSQAQITAALFQLQPDLFKPTSQEVDAATNAIKEGQAWTTAQAQPKNEDGSYRKLGASGPLESAAGFDMKWSGNHYELKFQKSDLMGVGFKMEDSGWRIVGAFGKPDCTVGIFAFKSGSYSGSWFGKPGSKEQNDTWKADAQAVGKFSSKVGNLTLADAGEQLGYRNKLRLVTADGGKKGVAYKCGNDGLGHFLVIVVGTDAMVFDFESKGGSFTGDYFGGPAAKGFFNLTN